MNGSKSEAACRLRFAAAVIAAAAALTRVRGIGGQQSLRPQSGDSAGQHVAHAAAGHAGIATVTDRDHAII
jgi:hypothetical protein